MTSGAADFCQVRSWAGDHRTIGRTVAAHLAETAPLRLARLVDRWTRPGPRPGAAAVASVLRTWWPPLLEELQSLAAAAGVPAESVVAAWAPPEVLVGGGSSCTVLWVPPELTKEGRPLVGRNFDLRLEHPERLLVYTSPAEGFAHVGCAGWCGRSEGVNERGLAVGTAEAQVREEATCTEVSEGSPSPASGGVPARLATRIALERCATAGEAVDLLCALPQWTRFNYLVADADGDAAVVEVGTRRTAVRRAEVGDGPWLVTTNHFVSPELAGQTDFRWLTRQKYRAAVASLDDARRAGRLDAAACGRVLAAPGVAQRRLTLWSVVFEPGLDRIWFAPGRPDRNGFVELPGPLSPPGPCELALRR